MSFARYCEIHYILLMFKLGVQATEEFIRQIEFSWTNADVDTGMICDIV